MFLLGWCVIQSNFEFAVAAPSRAAGIKWNFFATHFELFGLFSDLKKISNRPHVDSRSHFDVFVKSDSGGAMEHHIHVIN